MWPVVGFLDVVVLEWEDVGRGCESWTAFKRAFWEGGRLMVPAEEEVVLEVEEECGGDRLCIGSGR